MKIDIDLTEYDIESYERNPIVTANFGTRIEDVIGKAVISDDKKSVTIDLISGYENYHFFDTTPLSHIDIESFNYEKELIAITKYRKYL